MRISFVSLLVLGSLSSAVDVHADPMAAPESIADTATAPINPRSYAKDWMVAPTGTYVAGGRLRFVLADTTPFGGEEASMTDLALFDLFTRASLADRLELTAGLTTLAKDMTGGDEAVFQGGYGNLRVGLASYAAIDLGANARPLIGDAGWMVTPGAALSLRKSVDRYLRFQGGAGVSWNLLYVDDQDRSSFVEAGVHGEIVFPMGHAGAWLGSDYRVPVTDAAGPMELDPQPRLGFHAGWAFTFVPEWNLYAEYSIIDRGDLADPTTTLPIIDGGFDQSQIVFGVSRRFHDTQPERLYD